MAIRASEQLDTLGVFTQTSNINPKVLDDLRLAVNG